MATASVSEASGHGTVMATRGISPDDSTSTKILSELNLLAILTKYEIVTMSN